MDLGLHAEPVNAKQFDEHMLFEVYTDEFLQLGNRPWPDVALDVFEQENPQWSVTCTEHTALLRDASMTTRAKAAAALCVLARERDAALQEIIGRPRQ